MRFQPGFLLFVITFALYTKTALAHEFGVLKTSDKKFKVSLIPSGKKAGEHVSFFINEPISLDIEIKPLSKDPGEVPSVTGIQIQRQQTKDKISTEPQVRPLSGGTFFADNITIPITGFWDFNVTLKRGTKSETLKFSYNVKSRGGDPLKASFPSVKLPDFSLTDASGKEVKLSTLKGRVWVVDFFFASCPDVCPLMTQKMAAIQKHFAKNPDFFLVSITTDPKKDTPQALAEYAKKYKADQSRWYFLTGDKKAIAKLGTEGFKLPISETSIGHSAHFVIVDREGATQGIYDSEVPQELEDLKVMAKALLEKRKV